MTDTNQQIKHMEEFLKEAFNWQYPYSTAISRLKEKEEQNNKINSGIL